MDPRLRADEALARARARGAFVVTPDNATSPMDASTTVRIPRDVVENSDPDHTQVISQSQPMPTVPPAPQQTGWPTDDPQQQVPPNPYQAQRGPGEFGPLGSRAAQQQYPQY
ncbi:hypothetical protein [Saccharopolyspora taberi]|uniref:Uncharacterized protein n=1 Tax=Saccharopolyspora taberi TaxID=60895 RepID=A0ABN3VLD7_9PSEU